MIFTNERASSALLGLLLSFVIGLLVTAGARAEVPGGQILSAGPTELEYYLWPDHCKARMSGSTLNRNRVWLNHFPVNEAFINKWQNALPKTWPHLHHYCMGLAVLSHAERATPGSDSALRAFHFAAGEIGYTRIRSSPGSPLWSEMTINQARALEGGGDRERAIHELQQLVERSPSDTNARVALARTLKRGGDIAEAVTVLEQALADDAKRGPVLFYLARYYYELGEVEKASKAVVEAEHAGMKMDSIRERIGPLP